MSEVSQGAKDRALELMSTTCDHHRIANIFARYIQQVSDAAKDLADYIATNGPGFEYPVRERLAPFILPEPVDPLAEAWRDVFPGDTKSSCARYSGMLRKALAERGMELAKSA